MNILKNNKYIKKNISKDPLIFTVNNFLTDYECKILRNFAKDKLIQSLIGEGKRSVIRTGKSCFIRKNDFQFVEIYLSRVSELLPKKEINTPQSINIIFYELFQSYAYHTDAFSLDKEGNPIIFSKEDNNQRRYTAISYLNNVEKGGETRFHELDINIKPKKGKLLIFKNVKDNSDIPDKKTVHGGLPVIKGEKWISNCWF